VSEIEALVRELARAVVRDELKRIAPEWEWLALPEAAKLLGCTVKAVRGKFDRGVLTKHTFDGHVYASRTEIDRLIREGAD
jgi:hypothetical protein